MTAETNRRLVQRFVDEWLNMRRRDALDEICEPAIAFHWGPLGDGTGVDGLFRQEERVRAAFPDLIVGPAFTVADERYVVNYSIVSGTHRGRWFGLDPTNRSAKWTAVEIYRITGGRIAEQWLNEDWATVMQQLGRLPVA